MSYGLRTHTVAVCRNNIIKFVNFVINGGKERVKGLKANEFISFVNEKGSFVPVA